MSHHTDANVSTDLTGLEHQLGTAILCASLNSLLHSICTHVHGQEHEGHHFGTWNFEAQVCT